MEEFKKNEHLCECGCEHEHDEACNCGNEDETVQLTDENGKVYNFYHIATLDYEEKTYAFFQPAEEVEGVDPDEVVIFEVNGEGELLPVTDQETLDAVFNAFVEEMGEEDGCECGCEHGEECDCGCGHGEECDCKHHEED